MAMKALVTDYREHGANIFKWKAARKAIVVLAITDLVNSLAQSVMDAIRYRDDDEEYLEKEMRNAFPRVCCLELDIEHMTGKLVNEA